MHNKIFLIFFGPPGSGKGTQADMLAEKIKLPVICPGELLRHEMESKTEIGEKVKLAVNSGKMVSEAIIEKLIDQRLRRRDAKKGAIFDGCPRRKKQLNFLIKKLLTVGASPTVSLPSKAAGNVKGETPLTSSRHYIVCAILVNVSNKEVKRRLGGRRVCDCGAAYHIKYNPPKKRGICDLCKKKLSVRSDDKPAIIADRLKLYHKQTEPLLDYFQQRGELIKINGEQSIKDVEKEIWEKTKNLRLKI